MSVFREHRYHLDRSAVGNLDTFRSDLLVAVTCRMHTAPVGPTKATCWPLAADGESLCHQAVTTPYSAPYGMLFDSFSVLSS